ncbi:MAG: hypothetical protein AABX65_03855 [Nanoarchaeota archaeon]
MKPINYEELRRIVDFIKLEEEYYTLRYHSREYRITLLDLPDRHSFGLQGRGGAPSYIFVSSRKKSKPLEIGGNIMRELVRLHLLQEGMPKRAANREAIKFQQGYLEDDLKDVFLRY